MDSLLPILLDTRSDIDFLTRGGLIDDKLLDSFDIVSLIAAFDSEFDITVPAEEIIPENFNSAAAILSMLNRLYDE
jgi:acyl carrier protein